MCRKLWKVTLGRAAAFKSGLNTRRMKLLLRIGERSDDVKTNPVELARLDFNSARASNASLGRQIVRRDFAVFGSILTSLPFSSSVRVRLTDKVPAFKSTSSQNNAKSSPWRIPVVIAVAKSARSLTSRATLSNLRACVPSSTKTSGRFAFGVGTVEHGFRLITAPTS